MICISIDRTLFQILHAHVASIPISMTFSQSQSDTFFIPHVSCSIPSTFSKSNILHLSTPIARFLLRVIPFPQDLAHYGPDTVNLCSCDCRKQGLDFGYHCVQCCPLKVLSDDYSSFRWHCNIIVWCVCFMMLKIDSDLPWNRVINFTTWNPETTAAIVAMHSQCVMMLCTFFWTWAHFLLPSAILQTPVLCLMPTHKKLVFLHSSISCMVSLYICMYSFQFVSHQKQYPETFQISCAVICTCSLSVINGSTGRV